MITLLEMSKLAKKKGLDFEYQTYFDFDRFENRASFDSYESETVLTIFENDRTICHNFTQSGFDGLNYTLYRYERYNRNNGYSCSTYTKKLKAESKFFNL